MYILVVKYEMGVKGVGISNSVGIIVCYLSNIIYAKCQPEMTPTAVPIRLKHFKWVDLKENLKIYIEER